VPSEWSAWSEPEAVTANAEGRLTSAQRAEIIGPPVAAPRVGSAVLVVGLIGAVLLGLRGVGGIVLVLWRRSEFHSVPAAGGYGSVCVAATGSLASPPRESEATSGWSSRVRVDGPV
jgi:hypothetical protein